MIKRGYNPSMLRFGYWLAAITVVLGTILWIYQPMDRPFVIFLGIFVAIVLFVYHRIWGIKEEKEEGKNEKKK